MIKIITTDSYFDLFPILAGNLKDPNAISDKKNLVFCDEKASLMTERKICEAYSGSFNTEVFSFGSFLRAKINKSNELLSKEGSSMAVRKVLSTLRLKYLKSSKIGLAPSLFELIGMLKSANVTPKDLLFAAENSQGVLKNKLLDVYTVFLSYEDFITGGGYLDQNSYLTLLPNFIETSEEVKRADVFLVGFTGGFTRQATDVIRSLLKTAENVTAIFVSGENRYAYLNESEERFKEVCAKERLNFTEERVAGKFSFEGKILSSSLFDPFKSMKKTETDKIKVLAASSKREEALLVAEEIKRKVLKGERYKSFSVAIPDPDAYTDEIEWAFSLLGLPFFNDRKKRVAAHPLVTLINAYCDLFKKNFQREYVIKFAKNPLVSEDKSLSDAFSDYLIKYNIDYSKIKEPFIYEQGEDGFDEKENLRKKICGFLDAFDVKALFNGLSVSEKLKKYSEILNENGFTEESAVNDQVFDHVTGILNEMDKLSYTPDGPSEFKEVFKSGVSALELSLLPQYNDAVFVGGFKECSFAKAKYLFVMGLIGSVPRSKEDVAVLNDSDVEKLEDLKLFLEPKITIVNKRAKEDATLCVSSFSDGLYLSYPVFTESGALNEKSEIVKTAEELFTVGDFDNTDGYLSEKEGLYTFAKDCNNYSDGFSENLKTLGSFYHSSDKKQTDRILELSREEKVKRIDGADALFKGETSPTALENFFKCPYMAFMESGLKLKERVKSEMDYSEIGTVMHEIFQRYTERLGEVKDRASSDKVVEDVKGEILKKTENNRHLNSRRGRYLLAAVFEECKDFCYRNFEAYGDSAFKFDRAEVKFGVGHEKDGFPAIELQSGEIKIKGVIDRIDTYGDYCRIIDYKTGNKTAKDSDLFVGVQLQLFLYAAAVKEYKLAGVYYMPVLDKFVGENETFALTVGKTVDDETLLNAQDKNFIVNKRSKFISGSTNKSNTGLVSEESLKARVEYALKVCEKGAKEMLGGYIEATPFSKQCENCQYIAVCGKRDGYERNVKGGINKDSQFILRAVEGEEDAKS